MTESLTLGRVSEPVAAADGEKQEMSARADHYLAQAMTQLAAGDCHAALVSSSHAAISRRGWPGPYRLMAEACSRLGDAGAAEGYLRLAAQLDRDGMAFPEPDFDVAALMRPTCPVMSAAAEDPAVEVPTRIKFVAGGDVCLGRQLPGWVGLHGPQWPLQHLGPRLRGADLAMVNLETTVATVGDFIDKSGRRPYYYHNRPEMLDVLVEAGIQVVCTANNHAMDYGPEALEQQCNVLDACGFAYFGAGRDELAAAMPAYVRAGDLTIAFIGVETETEAMRAGPSSPGIQHARGADILPVVAASMAQARAHADVIIVSPHWGKNWLDAPSAEFRGLAKAFVDLGADAVLGHSAHILQGIELHAGRPIVYDMGTLLFDRVAQNRMRYSALFELSITRRGVERVEIIPVSLSSGRAILADGLDAGYTRKLMLDLSQALDSRTRFTLADESLVVECAPAPKPGYRRTQPQAGIRQAGDLRGVAADIRAQKSNAVYPEVPTAFAWPSSVNVNADLAVLGAHFATQVKPGRGFLCEVWFRAGAMPKGRWEARITGALAGGAPVFTYTHPVAEGIWPTEYWRRDEVIGDRVVVRPSRQLPEGSYQLFWQLVDLENDKSMNVTGTHPRLSSGKVFLGQIEVTEKAPAGVAGVAYPLPASRNMENPVPIALSHAVPDSVVERGGAALGLGRAEAVREGWQCHVYLFKNHVVKVLKTHEESWNTVAREYEGDTAEAVRIVREAVLPSIELIERNAPPAVLLGNFEVLDEGVYLQARGESLGERVARLARQARIEDIRGLLARTLDLVVELWRYGLSETSWKFNKNYGVLRSGDVALLDCLELTGDRDRVQKQIEQRRWEKKNRRFIEKLPAPLADEFRTMIEARLSSQVLTETWGARLDVTESEAKLAPSPVQVDDAEQTALLLDYRTIARLTGGEWRHYRGQPELNGFSINRNYLRDGSTGNLFFVLSDPETPDDFGAEHHAALRKCFELGAIAAVVPRSARDLPEDRSLLLVEGVREALKTLGLYARDHFTGKRVLVTGTEGKTGFKCMLGHVLSKQFPVQFVCNSSNVDSSLYASLASIRRDDRVAILEASVAQPGRGVQRSHLVKPHVAVITEVGNEHLKYHGTQQALIEAKSGIVDAVMDGGYCVLNADSANYVPVRKAVLERRRLPILTFGSSPGCNGVLRGKEFVETGWRVQAEIEGESVEYVVPLLGEHIPLATVSVLLTAYHLGADVARAAASFTDFVPYESQGVLRTLTWNGMEFLCYDNASRGSVLSYQSTLAMVPRLQPMAAGGRKIGVIGQMIFLGEATEAEHRRLAEWVDAAGFDALILVGENTRITFDHLANKAKVVGRFFDYDRRKSAKSEMDQLVDGILAQVCAGDLLFVKGELDEVGGHLRMLEVGNSVLE